ncbi:gll3937 [Gloeobacter violaceus PCC 7421]|uniref:Gll3937 protein n=1 Tax=Gloeobacter violaceus (strain ATCC 29082 / PCC 7421) TaxID=251221 RepID=Q7NEE3_GLOVI|nr:gll3937 [Gloeobacter violaceus PCC 7421]
MAVQGLGIGIFSFLDLPLHKGRWNHKIAASRIGGYEVAASPDFAPVSCPPWVGMPVKYALARVRGVPVLVTAEGCKLVPHIDAQEWTFHVQPQLYFKMLEQSHRSGLVLCKSLQCHAERLSMTMHDYRFKFSTQMASLPPQNYSRRGYAPSRAQS